MGKRAEHVGPQAARSDLAHVDVYVHEGSRLALRVEALGGDYRFTKVLLVLNPIQLDLQAGELILFEIALLHQRVDGLDDIGRGGRSGLSLKMVQFKDHDTSAGTSISARARR